MMEINQLIVRYAAALGGILAFIATGVALEAVLRRRAAKIRRCAIPKHIFSDSQCESPAGHEGDCRHDADAAG
jgi:hypothetical protein